MNDLANFAIVIAIWGGLGATGGLPAVLVGRFVSYAWGWVILAIFALAPLSLQNAVNPAFGGWFVLALPFWSGSLIAAGYLFWLKLRGPTSSISEL